MSPSLTGSRTVTHPPRRFDIEAFDFASEDEPGMLNAVRKLNELITAEVDAGIPADRIIIGGFSQGGAMSLLTGLTSERRLGGIVVMSGWLPLKAKFKAVGGRRIWWSYVEADWSYRC